MGCSEQLFNLYYNDVFQFVMSRVRNKEVALDITQDTFVRACENLQIDDKLENEKVKIWLLTVSNNLCIDYWRQRQRSTDNLNVFEDLTSEHTMSVDSDPLQLIKSAEIRKIIRSSIESLKWEHQQAINLFDIKQLTYKESASILGISDVAFSSLLRRARSALISEIIKHSVPHITKENLSDREIKQIAYWFDIFDIPSNLEEEIVSKSRNFFNGIRENYESYRAEIYHDKTNDFLLSTIDLKKTDTVADIGCGTGDLSFKLSPLVEKVYAIDHSVEMLNMLRTHITNSNKKNIHPILSEVGPDFNFPDELLNVCFCSMVLHHVFDPKSALKKIAKTIVPGGHLIIADIAYTTENWKFKDVHDFWSGFKLRQIAKWLEDAGFKVIHLEENEEYGFKFYDTENESSRIEIPLMYAHCIKEH